jgi:hypothetical protein
MTHPRNHSMLTLLFAGVVCALFGPEVARADIVVSQLPNQLSGGVSDTEFLNFGQSVWQRSADDFVLSNPATIRRVIWWGFFGDDFDTVVEPPPPTQTVRVTLYEPRPGDGLPGNKLFEEFVVDPPRVPTGLHISIGAGPPEYRYEVDLAAPWPLASGTPYWLEITQIGLLQSRFRWERAFGNGTPHAFINAITGDWRRVSGNVNLALQLSTIPEPGSILGVCLVLLVIVRRGTRARVRMRLS